VDTKGFEAVQTTLEQIDLVKRIVRALPRRPGHGPYSGGGCPSHPPIAQSRVPDRHRGRTPESTTRSALLRQMYDAGARYMTLTHTTNTDWADLRHRHSGASRIDAFRRGSGPRDETASGWLGGHQPRVARYDEGGVGGGGEAAGDLFRTPRARAIVDHPRNVPDDILKTVGEKGRRGHGQFLRRATFSAVRNTWGRRPRAAETDAFSNSPPYVGLYIGTAGKRAKAALAEWVKEHPRPGGDAGSSGRSYRAQYG